MIFRDVTVDVEIDGDIKKIDIDVYEFLDNLKDGEITGIYYERFGDVDIMNARDLFTGLAKLPRNANKELIKSKIVELIENYL